LPNKVPEVAVNGTMDAEEEEERDDGGV